MRMFRVHEAAMETQIDLEKGLPLSSMGQSPGSKPSTPSVPSTISVDKTITKSLPVREKVQLQHQKPTRVSQFLRREWQLTLWT
jgi:hypothetical protein